ncbi:MAG: hypothetical protein ACREAA_14340 [Candidatus Polarisedimenticolia bacterium]
MVRRRSLPLLAALVAVMLVPAAVLPALAKTWGTSWFPIGPAPACCMFPGGESGRATAVAMNPFNQGEIWLGTAGGGVWHTTNADYNPASTWKWFPVSDQPPVPGGEWSLAIGALAVADCTIGQCTRIYAGTGENAIRRDTYHGKGLLFGTYTGCAGCAGIVSWSPIHDKGKSLDGTTDWDFRFGSINDILLDPSTTGPNPETQVIYITLSSGVTASASETTVTAPEPLQGSAKAGYGLYKSTNNGINWDKLIVLGAEGARPTDLEMDPQDPNVLYAAFGGRGIFKTTDGGNSWCPLNPGIPRPGSSNCPVGAGLHLPNPNTITFDHVELAIERDPTQHEHLYASFGMCPERLTDNCKPSIFETVDGGDYWYARFQGTQSEEAKALCPSVYSRYTHGLTIAPGHDERLFLGGVHLCVSSNRGTSGSWSAADDSLQPPTPRTTIHFDHRELVFDAVGLHALSVNDGGIYSSNNQGFTWTSRNDTIQTIGFQSVATSSQTNVILGGTQDNSAMIWAGGGKVWDSQPGFGDAGYCVLDEDFNGNMYSTTNAATSGVVPLKRINGGSWQESVSFFMTHEPSSIYYPPLVQSPAPTAGQMPPQHALYYGTHSLWRSDDDAASWTPVSPELCSDLGPEPEIAANRDVVSAIAVAPGDPERIYVGCYSGRVWVTDSACGLSSCWSQIDFGLPAAPVTWLAVDPVNKDLVWATLSGFFPGSHVFQYNAMLVKWLPTSSIKELNGVPANTIAVEPHGPSQPRVLWLGTDKGVYRSPNGGLSWSRYGNGLPQVPVYQVSIDETHNRIVAGTHGRGAYMLTGPRLGNFNDCQVIYGYDLPIFGTGFPPTVACTMKLLREFGTVCGNGPYTHDADGGLLKTDRDGTLVTSKGAFYDGKPVALGCHAGKCAGGTTLNDCNRPTDRLAAVVVTCGNQVGLDQINGCPALINPPSGKLTLTGLQFPSQAVTLGMCGEPDADSLARLESALTGGGSFDFAPTVQSGDGTSRVLCSVSVPYLAEDTPSGVLTAARDAVNASPACQTSGVSAQFVPPVQVEGEDPYLMAGTLWLSASGLAGSQLVGSIDAPAGQADGICFGLGNLGTPVSDQLRLMRVRIRTAPSGAQGGTMTVKTHSNLGECAITVPTGMGQSSMDIANAISAAFQAPEILPMSPQCPPGHNPRDVRQEGDSLIMGLASEITVCLDDPGVGMAALPADVCFTDADCADGNPCTQDTCPAAGGGQCQHIPEPDGIPCDDQNACTLGGLCNAGTCGTPIVCNDGLSCTDDVCDPAIGACVSSPVTCDDANPCTADLCNPDTGGCLFLSLTGQPCDDGDLCTGEGTCILDTVSGAPACVITPACDDGDPCTDDACDPATGACQMAPIQCDDGNACTLDFCDTEGACVSVAGGPGGGGTCDDGNACTLGDTCVPDAGGNPVCAGQLNTCDDDNACTTDSCDPATGGCGHLSVAIGDATGFEFTGSTSMTWSPAPPVIFWNTYRGTIPPNLLGSRAVPGPLYDQTCFESADSFGDGALVSTDAQVPPLGTAFYYLVSGVEGCGEGPVGRDGNDSIIPNVSPCLLP